MKYHVFEVRYAFPPFCLFASLWDALCMFLWACAARSFFSSPLMLFHFLRRKMQKRFEELFGFHVWVSAVKIIHCAEVYQNNADLNLTNYSFWTTFAFIPNIWKSYKNTNKIKSFPKTFWYISIQKWGASFGKWVVFTGNFQANRWMGIPLNLKLTTVRILSSSRGVVWTDQYHSL